MEFMWKTSPKQQGQSLIEIVFSIGVIMLVIAGIVGLTMTTIGSRTKGYDRKKAVELSQVVMENLIKDEDTDPASFWNLGSSYWTLMQTSQTNSAFSGYTYSVGASAFVGDNCAPSPTQCLNAVISISWSGSGPTQMDKFNRFFSRE